MSIAKQTYDTGQLIWIRKLNGTCYGDGDIVQDTATYALYITGGRNDFNGIYNHAIYKIDPTTNPPT